MGIFERITNIQVDSIKLNEQQIDSLFTYLQDVNAGKIEGGDVELKNTISQS
jgi:hypothetical protein